MEENNIVKQVDEDIEYNQMIKTIDNLSDKIEELQNRINKVIEFAEPFTEWEMCAINGIILNHIVNILKGKEK